MTGIDAKTYANVGFTFLAELCLFLVGSNLTQSYTTMAQYVLAKHLFETNGSQKQSFTVLERSSALASFLDTFVSSHIVLCLPPFFGSFATLSFPLRRAPDRIARPLAERSVASYSSSTRFFSFPSDVGLSFPSLMDCSIPQEEKDTHYTTIKAHTSMQRKHESKQTCSSYICRRRRA